MKTIKIFLASSEEMTDDRNAFGNLVRRLDNIYEKRGIRIQLFEWEDYDAAYNDRRKQDEYNEKVRVSDMFLALFHTKAGKFTIEEFDVATEEFRKHASPKVYTYCKDLQAGEVESQELKDFKKRLFQEMGHYWSRYNNRDSKQLHFVMQLQLVETSGMVEKLKLEDGTVMLEGMPIAKIDNLQFAAGNEAYQKLSVELATLPKMIEKARQRVDKFPNDEDLRDDLQQKLNRYNTLKEEFEQLQKALFDTAQRIATRQFEHVSDMLRRAIEAFEEGNIERANTLFDEMAREAKRHEVQLDQNRALVHQDIEAYHLQTKTVMADATTPIEKRIERVAAIYAEADRLAEKSAFDKEKYFNLLADYSKFQNEYGLYDKAVTNYLRLISLGKSFLGSGHPSTAASYNNIGLVYDNLGDYDKALEYYLKALAICEKALGLEHPDTATTYNNIGLIYDRLGDYNKALEYYLKALAMREKAIGLEHPDTASSFNNIGLVYKYFGDYDKALGYNFKALAIREKVLGPEHPDTAISYNNIGSVYYDLGDYDKALGYLFKALAVKEKILGLDHPDTATSYDNIGFVYNILGDYGKALGYMSKALAIYEKILGSENPDTATSYNNIGLVYKSLGDYNKALEYHFKALPIIVKVLGPEHPSTATTYNNIGLVYGRLGDYDKALEYYLKALAICEKVFGSEHPNNAGAYNNIGTVYCNQGDYDKAQEYYFKALAIYEKVLGPEHSNTKIIREKIDYIKSQIN